MPQLMRQAQMKQMPQANNDIIPIMNMCITFELSSDIQKYQKLIMSSDIMKCDYQSLCTLLSNTIVFGHRKFEKNYYEMKMIVFGLHVI